MKEDQKLMTDRLLQHIYYELLYGNRDLMITYP